MSFSEAIRAADIASVLPAMLPRDPEPPPLPFVEDESIDEIGTHKHIICQEHCERRIWPETINFEDGKT